MTTAGGIHSAGPRDGARPPFDRSLLVELAQGRLSAQESREVLDHVAADEELSKELDLVILMLHEGSQDERGTRYEQGREEGRALRESGSAGLILLRVAAAVLVMLGAGRLVDSALTSPYTELASVEARDLHLLTRDGSSDELAAMHAFLYKGEWQEAVRRADWYLSVYPDDPGRSAASVVKSAAMLMGARKGMLGFGVHYDQALVDSAMNVLGTTRMGGPTAAEVEQIDWFEAKALLMRGDPGQAGVRLRSIVAGGGICVQDARRILSELEARR
jgi:hypothetical protein